MKELKNVEKNFSELLENYSQLRQDIVANILKTLEKVLPIYNTLYTETLTEYLINLFCNPMKQNVPDVLKVQLDNCAFLPKFIKDIENISKNSTDYYIQILSQINENSLRKILTVAGLDHNSIIVALIDTKKKAFRLDLALLMYTLQSIINKYSQKTDNSKENNKKPIFFIKKIDRTANTEISPKKDELVKTLMQEDLNNINACLQIAENISKQNIRIQELKDLLVKQIKQTFTSAKEKDKEYILVQDLENEFRILTARLEKPTLSDMDTNIDTNYLNVLETFFYFCMNFKSLQETSDLDQNLIFIKAICCYFNKINTDYFIKFPINHFDQLSKIFEKWNPSNKPNQAHIINSFNFILTLMEGIYNEINVLEYPDSYLNLLYALLELTLKDLQPLEETLKYWKLLWFLTKTKTGLFPNSIYSLKKLAGKITISPLGIGSNSSIFNFKCFSYHKIQSSEDIALRIINSSDIEKFFLFYLSFKSVSSVFPKNRIHYWLNFLNAKNNLPFGSLTIKAKWLTSILGLSNNKKLYLKFNKNIIHSIIELMGRKKYISAKFLNTILFIEKNLQEIENETGRDLIFIYIRNFYHFISKHTRAINLESVIRKIKTKEQKPSLQYNNRYQFLSKKYLLNQKKEQTNPSDSTSTPSLQN